MPPFFMRKLKMHQKDHLKFPRNEGIPFHRFFPKSRRLAVL